MHKDIRLARTAARASNVPLPAAATADAMLSRAEQPGYAHRDIAGFFQVPDRLADAEPRAA